jgi:ABC-type phosphate transport system substrate-binding protein
MKLVIKAVAFLSMLGGAAFGQAQEMRGSDTLAGLTRAIINDLGLGSQLNYTGGGSGLGFANTCIARTSGQTVNPGSRGVNPADVTCAQGNDLQYRSDVVGMDGVNVIINDQGNINLRNIKVTDVGNIYHCDYTTWDQVPTSTVGGPIRRYSRDGNSGTTDVFTSRLFWRDAGGTHAFPSLPSGDENYWEERYSCVVAIHGDGATVALGAIAASDSRAIVYAGDPALMTGNRALCVINDLTDPPGDPVCPSVATIEDQSYYWARLLYYHHVIGISDSFGPTGAQATLLDAVSNPDTSCAYLDGFLPQFGFYQAPRCYNP